MQRSSGTVLCCLAMRGSRNFHEKMVVFGHRRGGGGVQPHKKSRNNLFKGNFPNSRGGPDPRSPPRDPRMLATASAKNITISTKYDKYLSCVYLSHIRM